MKSIACDARMVKDVMEPARSRASYNDRLQLTDVSFVPISMTGTPIFYISIEMEGCWVSETTHNPPALHFLNGEETELRYANIPAVRKEYDRYRGRRRVTFLVMLPSGSVGYRINWVDGRGEHIHIGTCDCLNERKFWLFCPAVGNVVSTTAMGADIVFVGGAAKSGTTWLERILNMHSSIYCCGQGGFFRADIHDELFEALRSDRRDFNYWRPTTRDISGEADLLQASIALRYMAAAAAASNVSCVIDRSPDNAFHYDKILSLFVDVKMIHCVRHPLDVHVSRMFHERNLYKDGNEHLCYLPLSTVRRFHEALASGDWEAMKTAMVSEEAVVWVLDEWRKSNESALRVKAYSDDVICIIRYEDLIQHFDESVAKIFEFLGVSVTDDLIKDIKEYTRFERMAGRDPGKEDPNDFFRKGVSGDYLTYFAPDEAAKWIKYLGSVASSFGYKIGLSAY